MCERVSCIVWLLNKLNLTYRKLISFVASFNFIIIVLVYWDRFSLYHNPIRSFSAFRNQISILIVDYVIMRFTSGRPFAQVRGFSLGFSLYSIKLFWIFTSEYILLDWVCWCWWVRPNYRGFGFGQIWFGPCGYEWNWVTRGPKVARINWGVGILFLQGFIKNPS